jgi:peptide/nickel transport system substrate-binding protein
LKAKHPKYNKDATYESYTKALPNDVVPPVVLGAWVPVVHKPDELVVMRRNPYYFKVDEKGQQLPYYNEMHFRLSTWGDRTAQAVAGTGDFSNMEDPGNYVEALKQSRSADSPVKANFGPRVLSWRLDLNMAVYGANDDYGKALRGLFRETNFRLALSHALDRDAIGQAVARGPFAYPFTGGFATGSPYYDAASTDYHPFDQAKAKALLDGLGAKDSDGNGVRNLPNGGADIVIDVTFPNTRNEDRKQLDAMVSQLAEVGIRLLPKGIDETNIETLRTGGAYNAIFQRRPLILPTRETCETLPSGDGCPYFHQSFDGKRDQLDFEKDIAGAYQTFISSNDAGVRSNAAKDMQKLITENAYVIGTVSMPAALLVNKRIKNAHPGTPVFMYE